MLFISKLANSLYSDGRPEAWQLEKQILSCQDHRQDWQRGLEVAGAGRVVLLEEELQTTFQTLKKSEKSIAS